MNNKTTEDLEEDSPFTYKDFIRERQELRDLFKMKHALNTDEEIEAAISSYNFRCTNPLVERWVALHALCEYVTP